MNFKKKVKHFLWWITPRIYNLPQVYRICWMNCEYFIRK